MSCFLISGDTSIILAHSITRYFRYILGINLHFGDDRPNIKPEKNDLFFLLNEPSGVEYFFSWIHKSNFNPDRLRFMAIDGKADINLLEVETLKTQIERCIAASKGSNKLGLPFIFDRIRAFFKGHGEQSLLSCIGWINYYIGNYNTLGDSGEYSPTELNKLFLLPGLQEWKVFTERFNKYAPYLYISGWDRQIRKIERYIDAISIDLKKAEMSDSFHIFSSETLQSLKDIMSSLEKMASQIDCMKDETNPADH